MPDGQQLSSLFLNRLRPANIEAEQSFLGALLSNNKVVDRALFLRPEHFIDPIHGRIFEHAMAQISAGRLVNPVTIKGDFENAGVLDEVGGTQYLVGLITASVSVMHAGDYARVIHETWQRRQLIELAENIASAAYGDGSKKDAAAIACDVMSGIDDIAAGASTTAAPRITLDDAMDAALRAMERAMLNQGPAGVSTGFRCIDDRLGGLEPGLVYVLAGRPGMGKSALAHQVAINAARAGTGVLELSLEMSAAQLGRRALCAASGVPIFQMQKGYANNEGAARLVQARKELAGLPLTIDDVGGQTPAGIAAKARAAKRKHGLGLLMIDHLNLMRPEDGDAKHGGTWATGRASNTVLQIAKDCQCPVLLLAQLNRGPENREDKRPNLSDLRQAGDIEQDAYAVGFVYRAEYYLPGKPEQKDGETEAKHEHRIEEWQRQKERLAGRAEVIWAKVRDGEPGTDELTFHGPTTSFGEMDQ